MGLGTQLVRLNINELPLLSDSSTACKLFADIYRSIAIADKVVLQQDLYIYVFIKVISDLSCVQDIITTYIRQ